MSKIGMDVIGKSKLSKQEKILAYKTYLSLFEGVDLENLHPNWYLHKVGEDKEGINIVFRCKNTEMMDYYSIKVVKLKETDITKYPFLLYTMNTKNSSWDFRGRWQDDWGKLLNDVKSLMKHGKWRRK